MADRLPATERKQFEKDNEDASATVAYRSRSVRTWLRLAR